MRGLRASAFAISTICRRDSDRSLTSASGWMFSAPARASASSAMRRCARRSIRPKRRGGLLIAMLSATDRSGISDSSWKMQAMPAALAAAGDANETGCAVEQHPALVGRDDAGHDLDQRRLAGAVLAEHRVDAAGLDHELGVLRARARRRSASRRPPSTNRLMATCGGSASRSGPQRRAYLFASLCPMISCAVKLMPQVGNALPTKKLSLCAG